MRLKEGGGRSAEAADVATEVFGHFHVGERCVATRGEGTGQVHSGVRQVR